MFGLLSAGGRIKCALQLYDKLEFGGQRPQAMRARCSDFRYCPYPLGIVTAEELGKLEFVVLTRERPRLFLGEKLARRKP